MPLLSTLFSRHPEARAPRDFSYIQTRRSAAIFRRERRARRDKGLYYASLILAFSILLTAAFAAYAGAVIEAVVWAQTLDRV